MGAVRAPRQRVGAAFVALGVLLATFVLASPGAFAAGRPYSEYTFTFANGVTLTGSTQGGKGFEAPVPGTNPPETIHVSCSDVFDSGWSSNGAFPNPTDHPEWKILSYSIDRYKGDGTYHFTCGETFTPGSITVKKNATPSGEAFTFDLNGSIPDTPTGGTAGYNGETAVVVGDNSDSHTWGSLLAGTYSLSELMSADQQAAGWQLTGVSCTNGASGSASTIQLSLVGGQHITCTFSNALDDVPPPLEVSVAVVAGQCAFVDGASVTVVTITMAPEGGATVVFDGVPYTVSGSQVEVGPGSYEWSASAGGGYVLVGDTSGTVVAERCEPPPSEVSVAVVAGQCAFVDGASVTVVTITMAPEGGATVVFDGVPYTVSGSQVEVGPGSYEWSASAGGGYVLVGDTSGAITAIDCAEPPPTAAVAVSAGPCIWDGDATADVTVDIDPDGSAQVVITGEGQHLLLDGDGVIVLGPGDYAWTATAVGDHVLTGATEGTFAIADCTPAPARIGDFVWEDLDGDGVQDAGEPGVPGVTVNLWSDGELVASTVTDADGRYLFEDLLPGEYSVEFVIEDPYVLTADNVGDDATDSDTGGGQVAVSVEAGEDDLTIDAGVVEPATIVVVKRTEPAAEGLFDFFGALDAQLGDGGMAEALVMPGTYAVTEAAQDGWALVDLTCSAGGIGDVEARTANYTVQSGDSVTCTFVNTNEGSVVLEKLTDAETDDVFSFVVGSDTIELAAGESATLTLPAGEYRITEDLAVVDGWALASIVCSGQHDVALEDASATLVVEPGGTVGCTFVNAQDIATLGAIGDFVWEDTDADGIQEAGEPGVPGVLVELMEAETTDPVISGTTNAAGIYVLINVPAGDYQVRFTGPDGFLFTDADRGGDDAIDSDVTNTVVSADAAGAAGLNAAPSSLTVGKSVGLTEVVTLAEGEANTTVDAGFFQIEVLTEAPDVTPPPAKTPSGSVGGTTPDVAAPISAEPSVGGAPETDTKVLGIQELPNTGLSRDGWAAMALALILTGAGLLLMSGRQRTARGFSARL